MGGLLQEAGCFVAGNLRQSGFMQVFECFVKSGCCRFVHFFQFKFREIIRTDFPNQDAARLAAKESDS